MAWTSPYLSSTDPALTSLASGPFTIACWFEATAAGTAYTPAVFLSGPSWSVSLNADGTLTFLIRNSTTPATSSVSTVAAVSPGWNFVAVIYDPDSTAITIWLGAVSASATLTCLADSTLSSITDDFELGTANLTSSVNPDGYSLDSTSVWARALTPAEIGLIYGNGAGDDYPFLGGPFSLIFEASLINTPATPLVVCSQDSVYSVGESVSGQQGTGGLKQAFLSPLYQGVAASEGYCWTADNFNDKVLLAQHDNQALYWTPPAASAQALPGLPSGQANWDGVTVFQNHVVLWQNDTLLWSDVGSFTNFIPVAQTAVSAVLNLSSAFTQPPSNGNVVVAVAAPLASISSLSMSGDMTFPSTEVGQTSPAQGLTLTNTGDTPLNISSIVFPAGFSCNYEPGTIAIGGSWLLAVSFTPTAAGAIGGAISVGCGANTTGTLVYPISGTGTSATRIIGLSGILDFAQAQVGYSLSSSLIITNTGTAPLVVSGITFTPAAEGFSTSFSSWPVTIAAPVAPATEVSYAVPITFSPTSAVPYIGSIAVASNATNAPSPISVTGTGVHSFSHVAVFMTDNGTCQFNPVSDGSDDTTGVLTIYNPTGIELQIVGLSLPSGFSASCSTVIHGFDSVNVAVTFAPTTPGDYGGSITATAVGYLSGDAANGITYVSISGTGVAPGAVIQLAGSLDFGDVQFGGYLQSILSITNTGSTNLVISGSTFSPNFTGTIPSAVGAGETATVVVTFTPAASGTAQIDYTGTLSVTSNAPVSPATFSMSGSGIPAPATVSLVAGQYVSLVDTQGEQTYYNYYLVTAMTGTSLSLTLAALTGASPPGSKILADGKQFFTVDANEAGSTRVSGARMNGPIFRVIPQGDYAYIFKERSIQSIQYTGIGNGTFFIHNEISGEGLIGRNSVADRNDGSMVFLGHKELYGYSGGAQMQPVCQQYTRQLFNELDRSRLDDVILFHNENRKEIWVQYPVSGGTFKVLIWNYVEDSATIDLYDADLQFTALNWVDWSSSTTWNQLTASWDSLPASLTWDDLSGGSVDHAPLMASADGGLRMHGTCYNREGEAYTALSETMDYDLGAADNWKYVDVVVLGLQVTAEGLAGPPAGSTMYVQVGTQAGLGGEPIAWTAPYPILVDGTQPFPVKVNPACAGRYLRLRFTSGDPNVQWRVTHFEIHCRQGGFY